MPLPATLLHYEFPLRICPLHGIWLQHLGGIERSFHVVAAQGSRTSGIGEYFSFGITFRLLSKRLPITLG